MTLFKEKLNEKLLKALQRALSEMPMHSNQCQMRVGDSPDACTCWVKEARQAVKDASGAVPSQT